MSIQEILDELEPLFKEAESTGLWFWCHYQDLWFTPAELRAEHAKGSFIWGVVNWELRDPAEQVTYLERRIERAKADLENFINRIETSKKAGQQ